MRNQAISAFSARETAERYASGEHVKSVYGYIMPMKYAENEMHLNLIKCNANEDVEKNLSGFTFMQPTATFAASLDLGFTNN